MSVTHKTLGPEFFSPLGDVHTPQIAIPPCKDCGAKSLGGTVVELGETAPAGAPILIVDFHCGYHSNGSFAVMSDRLYPAYRILEQIAPSRLKIQRLPRPEQEKRIAP